MENDIYQLHMMVSGRVQGVGFRYYTQDIARKLKIPGWVRNTPDRKVEILSFGSRDKLEEFLRLIEKGPALSLVKDIQSEWNQVSNIAFSDFGIKY
jgi:acylphosphatase